MSRTFISHANLIGFRSKDVPRPKNTSFIIQKLTKNEIPLMVSKNINDGKDWAIYHLTQFPLEEQNVWRFAIASDQTIYTIYVLKNGECLERSFNVKDPKRKELSIVEYVNERVTDHYWI